MRGPILIVGQGLAGTLLGWALAAAQIEFLIADAGHAQSASRIAAGMINPVTGRRLVETWRAERLLREARAAYHRIETALGRPLWHDVRVRRLVTSDAERTIVAERRRVGKLSRFVTSADDAGVWIEGAARVDIGALLAGSRERWQGQGRLRTEAVEPRDAARLGGTVIDCRGRVGAVAGGAVPWEFSKGEVLEIVAEGLDPAVVINAGDWVAPTSATHAWLGATHEPGRADLTPTPAARERLTASGARLLQRPFAVAAHHAGVRVNLPDKRPVVGWVDEMPRLGVCNGLGAKGALYAPWLAQQWAEHLSAGAPFDPAVDCRRFECGRGDPL